MAVVALVAGWPLGGAQVPASAQALGGSRGARAAPTGPFVAATSLPPSTTTLAAGPTTTLPASPTTTSLTVRPPATTTAQSALAAAKLLAASIGAANAESALSWRADLLGGGLDVTELATAGRRDGTQLITGSRDHKRVFMQLVLIGRTVYVKGNASALLYLAGLRAPAAGQQAGKWVAVPAGAGHIYTTLAAGLTVTSATQSLDLVGKLQLVPKSSVAGQEVLGVQGTSMANGVPATQTVYVRASGAPLPVEVVQENEGVVEHMVFGSWGTPPAARAPAPAVSFKGSWL